MAKHTAAAILSAICLVLGLTHAAGAVQILEFPVIGSGADPTGITAGPDGALWFTEPTAGRIGRITTFGLVNEFPLPAGSIPGAIVAGPDGALWFTDAGAGRVGRITTSGVITSFPLEGGALDITVGLDGNLWVAYELLVPGPGALGRIARVTTSGTVTTFDVPSPARVATSLAAGPDGRIWFAGYGLASFGGNPFGVVGGFSTVDGEGQGISVLGSGIPQHIASGPDGKMWFTVQYSTSFGSVSSGPTAFGKIGRTTTEFLGLSEFAIPVFESIPSAIVSGPDGNVWFTDVSGQGSIGRVTPAGAVTELVAPSVPGGIAAGPNGNLWFTEPLTGRIAQISALPAICTPSPTALCLDNGRLRVEATWTTKDGATGAATAVPLGSTSTAGYLWFFSPETPEVTVKTIEGCALNGNVWFFAGGMTNVGVELKVTDIMAPTGAASKIYTNAQGTVFVPIQDTAAFPCDLPPIMPLRRD